MRLIISSLAGGFAMFLVGFLYLILEDIALADFTWAVNSNPSLNKTNKNIQRTLTGIQV
jgi:hypothetical protein